jgi:hypothetical protein
MLLVEDERRMKMQSGSLSNQAVLESRKNAVQYWKKNWLCQ